MPPSTNRSRIALVTERFPPDPGGLAASVGRLACGLHERGERVDVFCLSAETAPGLIETRDADGVGLHLLGRRRKREDTLADWIAHLGSAHRQDPFRLLHAYYVTRPSFAAVYVGGYHGVPTIVSARGNDLDRTVLDSTKAAHTLHALRHADAITANSRDLARKASVLSGGREIHVIPNGVDADHFRPLDADPRLRRELGLDSGPVVGFTGEAREKKGLAPLLVAFETVAQHCAATLLLVGGVRTEDRQVLDVFRASHPDLPVVVVDDMPPDALPPYYALIDVFVMPSLRDGLPNALLEAMACGRAIVGSDAGGIPDALEDDVNGKIVPAGDAEALASSIIQLCRDAEQRRRFGEAARSTVLQRFAPDLEIDRTLELYEALAPAAAGRTPSSSS